jgi:hypothetical protein
MGATQPPYPQRPETEKAAMRAIVSHVNLLLTRAFRLPEGFSTIYPISTRTEQDRSRNWVGCVSYYIYIYININRNNCAVLSFFFSSILEILDHGGCSFHCSARAGPGTGTRGSKEEEEKNQHHTFGVK